MSIGTTANSVFRDHVTLGVPASGLHEPVKSEIRSLFGQIDGALDGIRTVLTANLTLFVRTDGADTNDGSANTAGAAFRTLQGAWDYVARSIDLAGYLLTIQVADGTYTAGVKDTGKPVGNGRVQFRGNPITPANCIINSTAPNEDCFLFDNSEVVVSGFRMTSAGSAFHTARNGTILTGPGLEFGACTEYHFFVDNMGKIVITNSYTIIGGADGHWYQHTNGWLVASGVTITLTGTPAFVTGFAISVVEGCIEAPGVTFVGAATGRRFYINWGGNIFPGDPASLTYFPGSLPGENLAGFYGSQASAPTTSGTFTPSYEGVTTPGTTTHSAQAGNWSRVGPNITFGTRVQWSAHTGGAGGACIASMPFAAAVDWTFDVYYDGVTAGAGKALKGFMDAGSTKIRLIACDPGGGSAATVAVEAAGDIKICGTYIAA